MQSRAGRLIALPVIKCMAESISKGSSIQNALGWQHMEQFSKISEGLQRLPQKVLSFFDLFWTAVRPETRISGNVVAC